MATVWKDCKLVYTMSTNSDPQKSATVQRKDRDGTRQLVSCPPNVVDYNKFMGGVDHADHTRNYYRVRCKTRKFYRYIFWFLFDCTIVNAFILWKNYPPMTDITTCQLSIKNFRLTLANGLIAEYNTRQRYALPTSIRAACRDHQLPNTRG